MTSKPCPPSINKIPVCCEYYEPCTSECEDEECEEAEEEGYDGLEESEGQVQVVKRRCRKVPKKRLKPCIRRSQISGVRPQQHFEEKRPCRKLHPKPCRKRFRRSEQTGNEGYSNEEGKPGGLEDGEEEGEKQEEEEEGKEGGEHLCEDTEGGDSFGEDDEWGYKTKSEQENGNDKLYREEDEILNGKRPCRKKKKNLKKFPCKVMNLPEDESPLFPSLPTPNLGEKPPVQKFPPAEDKDSTDKKRFPCSRKKRKLKPCRRRSGRGSGGGGGGSSSGSSCTTSSSDEG